MMTQISPALRKLTSDLLRQKDAYPEQVELFVHLGGDRFELTEACCLEYADKFDWHWAGSHLLTPKAWARYQRNVRAAWMEYERAAQSAKGYPADYQYTPQSEAAKYRRAVASAFYAAWTSPENQMVEDKERV